MYDNNESSVGPAAITTQAQKRRSHTAERIEMLMRERDGLLPIWIRAPVRGPEHYSGLTRPKLYQLVAEGRIRSVSLREPGQIKGVRLFDLASILRFLEKRAVAGASCEQEHSSSEQKSHSKPIYKD